MKRMNSFRKAGLLFCILSLCHAADAKENKNREVCAFNEPVVFDFHSDSVGYILNAEIWTGTVKSNEKWVFTPVIVIVVEGDTIRQELRTVSAEGRLFRNLKHREDILYGQEVAEYGETFLPVRKDTSFSIPYSGRIFLSERTKVDRVYMSITIHSCCRYDTQPEIPADFANKNIGINRPFLPVTLKGDGETSENLKIRRVEGKAYLHFDINTSEINLSNLDNKKQIKEMTDAFRKILTDPYARFDSAYIQGQSSPEGPFEFNNKLAIKRSRSALGFLQKELDHLNIPYKESQFHVSAIPEAWDELSEKIASSRLSDKEKKAVLDIIQNTPIKAEREYKLRQRRQSFLYLKNEILGNIRRVDYAFYLTFKDLTLDEQISLLHTRPDIYTPSDFLAVANYTQDLARKTETLQIAQRYYPNDPEILASLLDVYLNEPDKQKAGALLDGLTQKDACMKNPKFLRNAGVYYLQSGQPDLLARDLYNLSFTKETLLPATQRELDYLQGLIYLTHKAYDQAYELLAPSRDMNAVLSLVGLGKYEDAWSIARDYVCTNPQQNYVKAVVAAYNDEEAVAIVLLKEAVKADPALVDKIKMEYAFYRLIQRGELDEVLL